MIWIKPRKPLVIGGAFCTTYAIVRIIGEQFRLPDLHIANQEFATYGITRGQFLSLGLLVMGIGSFIYAWRSNAPRMGGWLPAGEKEIEAYVQASGKMTGTQIEAEELAAQKKADQRRAAAAERELQDDGDPPN